MFETMKRKNNAETTIYFFIGIKLDEWNRNKKNGTEMSVRHRSANKIKKRLNIFS